MAARCTSAGTRYDAGFQRPQRPPSCALSLSWTAPLAPSLLGQVLYTSYWFAVLYIGGNLAHVPVTLLKDQTVTYKVQMLAHHALSIVCFVRAAYVGVGHYFVCLDGCCEVRPTALRRE